MEQKLDLIIQMIKNQGVSLNSKIDNLREELNGKYDSLREEMNDKHDLLNEKYDSLKLDVNRIETKLDNLSNQVTVLEAYAHEKCEGALDGWGSHLQIQEKIKDNVTNLNSKTENHEIRISVLEDVLEA